MKKTFIRGILVILAVIFAVAVSGCNSGNPDTSPVASQSPAQQSPSSPPAAQSPSATPSPSPSAPSAQSPSQTPTQPATPDPVISDEDPDDEPDYYEYESEFLGFFFQEYYYLDGDDYSLGLYFWDDGDVDLDDPDDSEYGEYDIDDDIITIYIDDEEYMILQILDCATLEDYYTGEIYALEGALDMELVTSDWYYLDGDENAGNLWFWDDGDVDIEDPYGDIEVGTYEVDDETIVIELDGDEVELTIINSYILESEYGDLFIRIP